MNFLCSVCESDKIVKNGVKNNTQQYVCTMCGSHKRPIRQEDKELLTENVRLAKSKQHLQDSNRIERKAFREYARIENALTEYNGEILEALKKFDLSKFTLYHEDDGDKSCGVVHLSDLHLNELVSLGHNKHDFNQAAKRLKKLANQTKLYFNALGIKNILIADTGDKLNSDRRLDEMLNQATNRSNATVLTAYLLQQLIIDLNEDFNISYACVTGNESRVKDEYGFSDIMATDNYDFTIFNMLRMLFKDSKGIKFIIGDPSELVVDIAGQHWLLLHGQSIGKDVEGSVQKIKGKYASRGVLIDYIIFGHIHSARISDQYSRGSSLVGDNDYSDKGLQLSGRASQNLYVAYDCGNRDGIKIDLQNVGKTKGYDIIKELESYNAKSANKLKRKQTIFQVVI